MSLRRLILAAVAVVLSGCGGAQATPTPSPVARVGDTVITTDQFNLRLESATTSLCQAGQCSPNATMMTDLRANILRGLIFDTVVAQEAAFRHVAPADADVQRELQQAISDAGGQSQLETQLAEAGGSIDQLRDEIRSRLTEQGLEGYFAKDRAAQVEKQLAQGADFVSLVKQFSDDSKSAASGGLLGTWDDTQVAENLGQELVKPVAALQPGQHTQPVRTRAGYEIVQVDAVTPQGRTLRDILVAAPDPYVVKGRPTWFEEAVFAAIQTDCQAHKIQVYISNAGADPCSTGTPSPSPAGSPSPGG